MGDKTGISWTDATWNPIRGCSRVSAGCQHCYAETVAARFSGPGQPYEGLARVRSNGEPQWTGAVRFIPDHVADPLRWRRPRRIFVNSMSDAFHERVQDEWLLIMWGVMGACPEHRFQVLTKRPERMCEWVNRMIAVYGERGAAAMASLAASEFFVGPDVSKADDTAWHKRFDAVGRVEWPLKNVWLGTSIENEEVLDARIRPLIETPAAVRFLSLEPLLGPIHGLRDWLRARADANQARGGVGLPGCRDGGAGDRSRRPDLADRSEAVESVGASDADCPLSTPTRGEGERGLLAGAGDDRREARARTRSPSCVASFQRPDSGWPNSEPQERQEDGQCTDEPRTRHPLGAKASRDPSAGRGYDGEPAAETVDGRSGDCHQGPAAYWRETHIDSKGLRGRASDNLEDRPRSCPSISWCIVGGESGKGHRPMEIRWLEHIVIACQAAGVKVFVKQDSGPKSGKQGRIPDELFIQEFPDTEENHVGSQHDRATERA